MRYAQGGGLTPAEQEKREAVRLEAAKWFEAGARTVQVAAALRVTDRSVQRWRAAWQRGGVAALASAGPMSAERLAPVQWQRLELPGARAPGARAGRAGCRGVEGRGVAAGKSTAHDLSAHICFADGSGQSLIPPRGRTWTPRGARPVMRVAGRCGGRVNIAGAVCFKPGVRARMFFKLHVCRGRNGEPKSFARRDYRDFIQAVHLPLGTPVVWVWDTSPSTCSRRESGACSSGPWPTSPPWTWPA